MEVVIDPPFEFFEPLYFSINTLLVLFCPLGTFIGSGQIQLRYCFVLCCYLIRVKQFGEERVVSSVPSSVPPLTWLRTGLVELDARTSSFLDSFSDESFGVSAR